MWLNKTKYLTPAVFEYSFLRIPKDVQKFTYGSRDKYDGIERVTYSSKMHHSMTWQNEKEMSPE